ncbi:MAG: hypothetical protein JWM32_327 [Verrucomicrobia bacterium]|nr:hypothetical protein [Verrucomicrobiota bacterium]
MRLSSKSDKHEQSLEEIPSEVRIWLSKGWVIIPAARRGYVLQSPSKSMRGLDKIGLIFGAILLAGFFLKLKFLGFMGIALMLFSWLDYKFNTKPPTKFFPEPGEKVRVMDRR